MSYLNPFKKKGQYNSVAKAPDVPSPKNEMRELPAVSRRLVEINEERKKMELPPVQRKNPVSPASMMPETSAAKGKEIHTPTNFNQHTYSKTLTNINDLLSKDVLKEMRGFWNERKDLMENTQVVGKVSDEIKSSIDKLHQMELEWQRLQLSHDKIKDELVSKEILIESQMRQLKKLFKKAHYNSPVPAENTFVLAGDKRLKTLQDFHDSLLDMPEHIFRHHVNEHKNDFSAWIGHTHGLKDLADRTKDDKDPKSLHETINNWMSEY